MTCSRLYKNVKEDIPDWEIQPEPDCTANSYWQYLFAKHHNEIARLKQLQPADIPPGWRNVTEDEAIKNLREMFNMEMEP